MNRPTARPPLALLFAALLALAPAPLRAGGEMSMLKDVVSVNDDLIRLGDLFTNAGDKAGAAIAYAPAPGRRAVFDARWLWRVAYAHGLNWRPMSLQDRAIVERDSQVIEIEAVELAIRDALVERGADPESVVEIASRTFRLHIPADATPAVAVTDVSHDERSGRFIATVVAPADDSRAQPVRVSGSLHTLTEVPVLASRVATGEAIREGDITWIKVRSDRLQRDVITDPDDLIGMAPKRGMANGRPMRAADVRKPLLVQKGGLVTLMVRHGAMNLTLKGKALEDGGDGATVRVENTRSGATVEGTVIGPNTVAVSLATRLAQN